MLGRGPLPRRIALIIACLCLPPLVPVATSQQAFSASLPQQVDQTPIETAMEDAAGVIWAMPLGGGSMYRWQGDRWGAVQPPGDEWRPYHLWRGSEGGVVAGWISLPSPPSLPVPESNAAPDKRGARERVLLTWRRGDQVRTIGTLDGSLYNLLPVASGKALVTVDGPTIDRVDLEGLQPVYTLKAEQFFLNNGTPVPAPRPFYSFLQLDATEDPQGNTWIWCDAPARPQGSSVLQGVLIYDGKDFAYHRTINGLPSQGRLSYLGPWDARHLVAAVLNDGLYLIDTVTLTAQRLTDPEPNAFREVQAIFREGSSLYALASPGRGAYADNPFHEFVNNLWRLRDGHWSRLIASVGNARGFSVDGWPPRAWTREGLWLGGNGAGGLWLVPAEGSPARVIDWRQGFSLPSVRYLFALPGNQLLAINAGYSSVVLQPASLLAAPAPPQGLRVLRTHFVLQPGESGHIWGFVDQLGGELGEWDGQRWLAHSLPPNLNLAWVGSLDADTEGRIWLFPARGEGPAAFFDSRQGKWQEFPSYQYALQAQGGKPLQFRNPTQDPALPAFGPKGQIAFMGRNGAVYYFSGDLWRRFSRNEILSELSPDDGPPFFDPQGHLKVDISQRTFEYSPGAEPGDPLSQGHWREVASDPGPLAHEPWEQPRPPGIIPAGCPVRENSSLSLDRLERYWWTWEGNLYEDAQGACKLVLAANQAQPFIDGRKLRRVLVDARGDVFFETNVTPNGKDEYILLPAP